MSQNRFPSDLPSEARREATERDGAINAAIDAGDAALAGDVKSGDRHMIRGGTFPDDVSTEVEIVDVFGDFIQLRVPGSDVIHEAHFEEFNELVRAHHGAQTGLHARPDAIPADDMMITAVQPDFMGDIPVQSAPFDEIGLARDLTGDGDDFNVITGGDDVATFVAARAAELTAKAPVMDAAEEARAKARSELLYGLIRPAGWPRNMLYPPREFSNILDRTDFSKMTAEQIHRKKAALEAILKEQQELMQRRAKSFDDWVTKDARERYDQSSEWRPLYTSLYSGRLTGKGERSATGHRIVRDLDNLSHHGVAWATILHPDTDMTKTGVASWSHNRAIMRDGGKVTVLPDARLAVRNCILPDGRYGVSPEAVRFMVMEMKARGHDTIKVTGNPEFLKLVGAACAELGMGAELRRRMPFSAFKTPTYIMPPPPELMDAVSFNEKTGEVKDSAATRKHALLTSLRTDPNSRAADILDRVALGDMDAMAELQAPKAAENADGAAKTVKQIASEGEAETAAKRGDQEKLAQLVKKAEVETADFAPPEVDRGRHKSVPVLNLNPERAKDVAAMDAHYREHPHTPSRPTEDHPHEPPRHPEDYARDDGDPGARFDDRDYNYQDQYQMP